MTPIRRVWVTRAEPGAARTADRLTALGFTPITAPLLTLAPLPGALDAAPAPAAVAALALTSPNGVEAFAPLIPRFRRHPVFAVGDATAEAARAAGFADVRSAAGDIHALARLIAAEAPPGPLLAPGAREPAGDLPALLPDRPVHRLPVYAAFETHAPAPELFDAVMLHSPRAARALASDLPRAASSGRIAICISEAAAAPLRPFDLAEIRIAVAPDEPGMLSALGKPAAPV
ncbi:uroporphyrinogen-III synthase [Brevundimonas diminuta]|jgi:uroporphyrinogen-III synthase|uniref:Uroporphyrinogen-III synthase n=2 Tax=Brevundimonas diminuta TaxID=293 RepID=A0A410NUH7_BREDI|nr:uroporphyrinogen-III synthase [Brevundimonas diminuta]MBD3572016.1 uroporphyrinogen-III synthase [Brevundimonas diminuta]QAT13633.1 uroporphyrinogen-III synthase [Brevundimonas diminuta]QQB89003.1 uroporphyrinogen-III synthase [Brevundimonas diminuta]GEB99236.1 uroporphyrinogen III methyltransferase [Brevundimonas diminuta]